MQEQEYLLRIREYLHDPEGKIWSNEELLKMLNTAAETYSRDTGMYRGRFNFLTKPDGSFRLPKGFVSFVAGWNSKGLQIDAIHASELSRFYGNYSAVEGEAEFCYEDFADIGKMRLCPNPHKKQEIKTYYPSSPNGLIALRNYGVPRHGQDYGLPVVVYKFKQCGDVVYSRKESFEKIHDYMALIYHVVCQAYTIDSEFQNTNKANLFLAQYKKRIASFGQLKATVSSIKNGGRYY